MFIFFYFSHCRVSNATISVANIKDNIFLYFIFFIFISLIAQCPTIQYQLQISKIIYFYILYLLFLLLSFQSVQRYNISCKCWERSPLNKVTWTWVNDIMMPIKIIELLFRLIFVQSRGHFFNFQPIRLLAQTTLRNILGTKNLHEILSERDSISNSMQVMCLSIVCVWNQRIFVLFRLLVLENSMHVK